MGYPVKLVCTVGDYSYYYEVDKEEDKRKYFHYVLHDPTGKWMDIPEVSDYTPYDLMSDSEFAAALILYRSSQLWR